jgi:hypothetical protein
LGETYTSPTTGNPLVGNASYGFQDPVTGERFTSDEIVGSINESESPLDYIGGFGLGGLLKNAGKALLTKGAKLLAKKAAKKAAKCPACAGKAAKEEEKAAEQVYRGDTRSPDQIRDAGGFEGKDPSSPATLGQHLQDPGNGTNFVSTSTDPKVASDFGHLNAAPDGSSYVYSVDPKGLGGVDVSKISPFPGESEVTFNKIPFDSVTGWERQTITGGGEGFVPNPGYVPK